MATLEVSNVVYQEVKCLVEEAGQGPDRFMDGALIDMSGIALSDRGKAAYRVVWKPDGDFSEMAVNEDGAMLGRVNWGADGRATPLLVDGDLNWWTAPERGTPAEAKQVVERAILLFGIRHA